MPKEIFPSSYECDCGHQSHFFENTIREAKAMSYKKKVYLGDSASDEHTIVFYKGKMVDIICPKEKIECQSDKKGGSIAHPNSPSPKCQRM
jgi:hypothetical protein